jgi:hypothetical protein
MDAWEMNDITGFIFISTHDLFCSSMCLFNFQIWCNLSMNNFIDLLTRILINGIEWILWKLDIWSVLKSWEFIIEVYVDVDAIVVLIWIFNYIGWSGLLCWFEIVLAVLFFLCIFSWRPGLLEYWILLQVRSSWCGSVFSPALDAVKLDCQKTVDTSLHLTGDNCSAQG